LASAEKKPCVFVRREFLNNSRERDKGLLYTMTICKDDLVTWFKKLESYKRIDVMCTLLNLCLPFELRFLGTCLEELGRRDAQDLRGVELRVNNSQEFVSEIMAFQQGQPTDMKLRRKMALYLALMRACNRTGVNELFRTLDRWGDRDFTKFSDGDPLQELLLVFTMATNHPVFSFEQRIKCGEIYSKIISSKPLLNPQSSSTSSPITSPPLSSSSSFTVLQQQHQPASPPPFQSANTFQPPPQLINPAATQQQLPNPMLMPIAFPQATVSTNLLSFFAIKLAAVAVAVVTNIYALSLHRQSYYFFPFCFPLLCQFLSIVAAMCESTHTRTVLLIM
jgi:hypothetical protein